MIRSIPIHRGLNFPSLRVLNKETHSKFIFFKGRKHIPNSTSQRRDKMTISFYPSFKSTVTSPLEIKKTCTLKSNQLNRRNYYYLMNKEKEEGKSNPGVEIISNIQQLYEKCRELFDILGKPDLSAPQTHEVYTKFTSLILEIPKFESAHEIMNFLNEMGKKSKENSLLTFIMVNFLNVTRIPNEQFQLEKSIGQHKVVEQWVDSDPSVRNWKMLIKLLESMIYLKTKITPANLQLSMQDINECISLRPNFPDAYQQRSIIHLLNNDSSEAEKDFNKCIEMDPGNADSYFVSRGLLYMQGQSPEQAIQDFSTAIEINPTNGTAYFYRGSLLHSFGNTRAALSDLELSVKYHPTAGTFFTLGDLYVRRGETAKALSVWDRLYEYNPKVAKLKKARLLVEEYGDVDLAIKCLDQLDQDSDVIAIKGSLYLKGTKSEQEQGLKLIQEALELDKESVFALTERGKYYMKINDFDKAVEDFNSAIQLSDIPITAIKFRAQCLVKKGQYRDAVKDFSKFLDNVPFDIDATLGKAECYMELGLNSEAKHELDHLVECFPKESLVYEKRAEFFDKTNDPKSAEQDRQISTMLNEKLDMALGRVWLSDMLESTPKE